MAPTRKLSLCIAGATGWTGRALVPAVLGAPGLVLGSAVSRSAAGRDLGEALGGGRAPRSGPCERGGGARRGRRLIDYTSATAVKANAMAAIEAGVGVVVGTFGLTATRSRRDQFGGPRALGRSCRVRKLLRDRRDVPGGGAPGGASPRPTGRSSTMRAKRNPTYPSGTARESAERLGEIHKPGGRATRSRDLHGPKEARGVTVGGAQIHSLRLPSFVVSTEVVFAPARRAADDPP